ncbi:DNA-binding MarR family transcriptional regulator/ribosomal protein S18 acetylase RimI-like enzyme [Caulobacter ginsengisoli]|uniref:DNA-binding MarR family transcriptional regulator/ribosomal protein S18 acetylase RimI-like enzyme n=1 Tax=Caulobacter ginsengisoli TaxID=400775 RepID=A0ABU0J042_9CAUL|nr:helix-turn-helix domain-containing GNAT family N-acetyltransferase [Caulobacter ginsengisoli]MDQ0466798.1 DNA-binding MarR family transcriptional regulator/ribosomal protein S18 acetylase RimI-like enzyme [Caulobacter ginsengisoli]
MSAAVQDSVAAVRRFTRFYTRAVGVLDRDYLHSSYTVAEGRVLFEIAQNQAGTTAKAVGEITGIDAGYLSRIVGRFERDGVVRRERSTADGRSQLLRLTEHGRQVFAGFDRRSAALVEGLIDHLPPAGRQRLVGALREAQGLLEADEIAPAVLRPNAVGDLGWVVERHAILYSQEYGWSGMESLCARVVADFADAQGSDPAHHRCWIAERAGERLGSVFMVREDETTARLRLLLLEPAARGEGLGKRLVEQCLTFAREAGFQEVVLWTHAKLTAARAIYARAGFQVEEVWTHDDFGQAEVSETWRVKL